LDFTKKIEFKEGGQQEEKDFKKKQEDIEQKVTEVQTKI